MRNTPFLFLLCLMLGCTKKSTTGEETIVPTATEKKVIGAASRFFASDGEYNKIQNVYRVAVRPVLKVRRVLTEGACTHNFFSNECCCAFDFLLTPYDMINGVDTSRIYPKTAEYTGRLGKMQGSISAVFPVRPVATSATEVTYTDFTVTYDYLNGAVSIKDVTTSPFSNNEMCLAEFSNNVVSSSSVQITSATGSLSFSDGDAAGKLDLTYADNTRIIVEVITVPVEGNPTTAFRSRASFTIDGIASEVDLNKATITIGERAFKLNL